MTSLEEWRKKFIKRRLLERESWDEDQASWQHMTSVGPMSLMDYSKNHITTTQGGSRPGRPKSINRDRVAGHERIWNDYFSETPTYGERHFRRRYRMRKQLFWRIHNAVVDVDDYFIQKRDAAGVLGLSSIQKITAAIRMLALGVSADALDEYVRIGESTAMKSLKRFAKAIRVAFEGEYLRQPTSEDMERQFKVNEQRGFPGMFASLDCMHYEWKNCPVAWQGLFTNKDGEKSIVLEAIADQSLWIWHAYFGLPGGNNDLNVLDRSPLVNNFLRSESDCVGFTVNGRQYNRYYLLTDSICPEWSIFISTILLPQGDARKWFAKCQESARKDVERAFGVLQQRFAIVSNPVRMHHRHEIKNILLTCVIIHNMIIEDERLESLPSNWDQSTRATTRRGRMLPTTDWKQYLNATKVIEDTETHYMLRNDLIEHLWTLKGNDHRFDYVGNQV